jgi:hypothetical protein
VACLRIVRPFVQSAQFLGGSVETNGTLRHIHFHHPITFLTPLPSQNLIAIRTQDVQRLKGIFPEFRNAMEGNYWKFRMAVDMFQSGYFQQTHWKLRFFMWTAALESLFTSHSSTQHRGSLVAKERIKFVVGGNTSIYPADELSQYETNPNITIADVIDEIYCLRNHLAHGDKVPDYYFQTPCRQGINGPVYKADLLTEALSSIIRSALLRILDNGLLAHYSDAASSESYFTQHGLTRNVLQAAGLPYYQCPQ